VFSFCTWRIEIPASTSGTQLIPALGDDPSYRHPKLAIIEVSIDILLRPLSEVLLDVDVVSNAYRVTFLIGVPRVPVAGV
jgi:hypothetical protein